MFRSRRRSREFRFTEADMRMRAALGDANIIAWYDARFPHTITLDTGVSGWADSRPASPGPSLVQTTDAAQPAYSSSARTITFDGTADYLRVTSTTLNAITAACALVVVGTLPATGAGSSEAMVSLGTSANATVLRLARAVSDGNFLSQADSDLSPQASRTSIAGSGTFHGRRSAASGGSITSGARIGGGAEGTSSNTAADATAEVLTVGASAASTPAAFADVVVKAVLVVRGTYTDAMALAVASWATAVHGVAA